MLADVKQRMDFILKRIECHNMEGRDMPVIKQIQIVYGYSSEGIE